MWVKYLLDRLQPALRTYHKVTWKGPVKIRVDWNHLSLLNKLMEKTFQRFLCLQRNVRDKQFCIHNRKTKFQSCEGYQTPKSAMKSNRSNK